MLSVDRNYQLNRRNMTQISFTTVETSFGMQDMDSMVPVLKTDFGEAYWTSIESFLRSREADLIGKVNAIITSPPFPLVRKKKYGNLEGDQYLEWFSSLAAPLSRLIADDGSIVIEMGNAWVKGEPTVSTLPLRALLQFQEEAGLYLAQEIICYNPSRLPGPAEWVTRERARLKDSFTRVWWFSKQPRPKADNRKVLNEYSPAMQKLLNGTKYTPGLRPSGHTVSKDGFYKDNGGAISPNVLAIPNAKSNNDRYRDFCRVNELPVHPARMQPELARFFIEFLTDPGDLVFDPFAGSLTTGFQAEMLSREWLATDMELDYLRGAVGRFL